MIYLIIGSTSYPVPSHYDRITFLVGVFNEQGFNRKKLRQSKLEELYVVYDKGNEGIGKIQNVPVRLVRSVYAHMIGLIPCTLDCPEHIINEIKNVTT